MSSIQAAAADIVELTVDDLTVGTVNAPPSAQSMSDRSPVGGTVFSPPSGCYANHIGLLICWKCSCTQAAGSDLVAYREGLCLPFPIFLLSTDTTMLSRSRGTNVFKEVYYDWRDNTGKLTGTEGFDGLFNEHPGFDDWRPRFTTGDTIDLQVKGEMIYTSPSEECECAIKVPGLDRCAGVCSPKFNIPLLAATIGLGNDFTLLESALSGLPEKDASALLSDGDLLHAACRGGHLEMAKKSRSEGAEWVVLDIAAFAFKGKISALQWAHADGAPWDATVCAAAAGAGHLGVLKWCRDHGAPWDATVCAAAAKSGHLEVLQWCRESGAPWDATVCGAAAKSGHLQVLQWCREQGAQWDAMTVEGAVFNALYGNGKNGPEKNRIYATLEWCIANQAPMSTECTRLALEKHSHVGEDFFMCSESEPDGAFDRLAAAGCPMPEKVTLRRRDDGTEKRCKDHKVQIEWDLPQENGWY